MVSGGTTVSFHEGRYIWSETPKDFIQGVIFELEKILIFMRKNFSIIPISADFIEELIPDFTSPKYIGEVNQSLLSVAMQNKCPIFSDDLVFNQYCYSQKINTFWTQTLLIDFLDNKIIDSDKYTDSIAALATANYWFTSITAKMLYDIWKIGNFKITNKFVNLLKILQGPDSTESRSIKIACDFLIKIWYETIDIYNKAMASNLVLDSLTTNGILEKVLFVVLSSLKKRFFLAPIQLIEYQRFHNQWKDLHTNNVDIVMGVRKKISK